MQSSVYRFLLTPADIGARVMVRRSLPASPGPGQPPFGDVLGVLGAWSHGVLTILTDGPNPDRVQVDEVTIVAGRRIPARPQRRGEPT